MNPRRKIEINMALTAITLALVVITILAMVNRPEWIIRATGRCNESELRQTYGANISPELEECLWQENLATPIPFFQPAIPE